MHQQQIILYGCIHLRVFETMMEKKKKKRKKIKKIEMKREKKKRKEKGIQFNVFLCSIKYLFKIV